MFPLPEPPVLGLETVAAVGGIVGVALGDEVAAWLPPLGGYGESALRHDHHKLALTTRPEDAR